MSFVTEYDGATSAKPLAKGAIRSNEHQNDESKDPKEEFDKEVSLITRVEFVEITEKERPGGEQPIVTLTSAFNRAREDTGRYREYALQVVRKLDKDGDGIGTELVVRSPFIRAALRSILASYAYLNLMADPIVIPKPYDALFHYRKEILAYAASPDRTTEETNHMKVLTERFFPLYLSPIEKVFVEEIPKGRVRFDLLWTLFCAEDDVVVQTEYFREIHRVVHCEEKTKDDETNFYIYTWRWGYNAEKFGPASETLTVPKFTSTRRIEQLPCFPVKFLGAEQQEELHKEMIERGRRWRHLLRPAYRQYEGPMWVDPDLERAKFMELLEIHFVDGRIMLDQELHVQQNSYLADCVIGSNGYKLNTGESARDSHSIFDDLFAPAARYGSSGRLKLGSRAGAGNKIILNKVQCFEDTDDYKMTDEEAWLSPARVRGFSLSAKRWAFFLVQNITHVSFKEDSFHLLEMKSELKETIRAVVEMHNHMAQKFDDIIKGKGKGIVISLEGPPGSGKTLTAESIAELTHRPLYSISTAELSTQAVYAEPKLSMVFARAARWNAVVLLDEADVFLTKRTTEELERNAFVTMFLRLLEYFQGIMFLTSNRVEEFDPAFSSRIHLKVPFESPDAARRAAIWRNFLKDHKDCAGWDADMYERLGRNLAINGREIKNLTSTSLAIAGYRKQPLSEDILTFVHSVNYGRSTVKV